MQVVLPILLFTPFELEIITYHRNENHLDNMAKYGKIQLFLIFCGGYK